jgi:hypothetical protein
MSAAGASEFEDYVYGLGDLMRMDVDSQSTILKQMSKLDPDCKKSIVILERIFKPDETSLWDIVSELGHNDFYRRSAAAQRILTFSMQDISDFLTKEEIRNENPEILFQVKRIRSEIRNNFYIYRKKVGVVRDNLLLFLANEGNPKFYMYAYNMYTKGSSKEQSNILRLVGMSKNDTKVEFLTEVFEFTQGPLLYELFHQLKPFMKTEEVSEMAENIIRSRNLPIMLKAGVAASLKGVKGEIGGLKGGDPFIENILNGTWKAGTVKSISKSSFKKGSRPRDTITRTTGVAQKGYVKGILLTGDIVYDDGKKTSLIPLFKIEDISIVPTGKRDNKDYICRIMLRTGNSISGKLIKADDKEIVMVNTYIKGRISFKPESVSLMQFGTEGKNVPNVHFNTIKVPRIYLNNSDTMQGVVVKKEGGRIGIKLKDIKVYPGSKTNPVDALYFDQNSIDRIEFPYSMRKDPIGFCQITSMYGDRISGNLIEMDDSKLTLFTEEFGLLTIAREKVSKISINSGFVVFREQILVSFPQEDSIAMYTIEGKEIWRKKGLDTPVYAERMSNGDLLVCERRPGVVSIYSRDFVLKREFSGFSQVSTAHELPNGNILVSCERFRDAIVEINIDGKRIKKYEGLQYIYDAVSKEDGTVLAISKRRSRAALLSPGATATVNDKYLNSPTSIQVLENGNYLVGSRSSVCEYTPRFSKVMATEITRFSQPKAYKHGDAIYVIDGKMLYKVNKQNVVVQRIQFKSAPDSLFMY